MKKISLTVETDTPEEKGSEKRTPATQAQNLSLYPMMKRVKGNASLDMPK